MGSRNLSMNSDDRNIVIGKVNSSHVGKIDEINE